MAIDGRFSVQSALERLLARCPELKRIKKIDNLVKKGDAGIEEVVNLAAELFVNPKYTILLVGCFRAISQKIIEKVVWLLGQCNLTGNTNEEVGSFSDAEAFVVEHCVRNGMGLYLHELACLAFARALDLDQSLWRSVSPYFKFSPPPFERILRKRVVSEISKETQCLDMNLLREHERELSDIRWSGEQILAVLLKLNGPKTEKAEEAASCLLRWEDFCRDVALEKGGSYFELFDNTKEYSSNHFSEQDCLESISLGPVKSSPLQEIEPAVKSRSESVRNPFVVTSAMRRSFEMVLLAVSQRWPVLLYGQPGVGKTGLISKLAEDTGNQVLSIHMDDQIDGKTLLGSYVCTEKPGEFRWQHGTLIQAVLGGYWVVFEDIDKAPADVQSILLPLLEGASSFVTGHGEKHLSESTLPLSFNLVVFYPEILLPPVPFPGSQQGIMSSVTLAPEDIVTQAVDIFAAFSASVEKRLAVMKEIADVWGVPHSEVAIFHPFRPEIQDRFHGKLVAMRSSLYVLERITCSVKNNESVLLVGETGTGKTTLVQNLAMMLGQKLTVVNLSQQSDVADLLGGFRPMDPQSICVPLYKEFENLFSRTFSVKENGQIFAYLQKILSQKNWGKLLSRLKKYVEDVYKKVPIESFGSGKKRKQHSDREIIREDWDSFAKKIATAYGQVGDSSGMIFSFIEGAFVNALRNGEWILLDEVNLAPPETLQRVIGVLEGEYGSLCLAEKGDIVDIPRHTNFRMFACMNPATDAGKRDLPYSLRSRFTEYFVDDVLDREDLKLFINKYLVEREANSELESRIIDFYGSAKTNSEDRLQDGANQKPQYSLRSLYRALEYTREASKQFGFQKALYDGFSMFFLTLLDQPSAEIMEKLLTRKLLGGKKPLDVPFCSYLNDLHSAESMANYVLTKGVEKQLENLARAVFIKRYPVLLQGPTSSGKTSLVQYLATRTGHKFVRINNHEHTDLQEYLGSYISDAHGKLVFHEGVLVKAVREGHWIVLDELNLAPSDVLEALNRLLDDNRELFVPELRETIRAHPNFMLFATQNPPTFYGGRKMLSRAFRNRFVEVHVDEIPDHEMSTIIEKRCCVPGSRAGLMVEVMKELQMRRQSSKVFAGKHGFITPRDLFRWASRLRTFSDSKEVMAEHGYYLLADRLRNEAERVVVREVLKKVIKIEIHEENLYTGFFPIRERSRLAADFKDTVEKLLMTEAFAHCPKDLGISSDIRQGSSSIASVDEIIRNYRQGQFSVTNVTAEDLDTLEGMKWDLSELHKKWQTIFMWQDGPLVEAMKAGDLFLIDEISLADDSVLERLNSVLEPERELSLAEKGGSEMEKITAHPNFFVLATMNPGGDYGKKELSPALRNRFTEIWVPPVGDLHELKDIALNRFNHLDLTYILDVIVKFWDWFNKLQTGRILTVRDLLSWVEFINVTRRSLGPQYALVHGLFLVLLDGLRLGTGISLPDARVLRERCISFIQEQPELRGVPNLSLMDYGWSDQMDISCIEDNQPENTFGISPFYIEQGDQCCESQGFEFLAPTTRRNAMRVLRAMQLPKPVLLEGSPGVGKTSLITALGKYSGHKVVRINLSEQTDLMDLLGSDLPVESDDGMKFAWSDGILLQALKDGSWVLLDELNLAPQSVLEGLNAILDHRAEVFIPELGLTFKCPPSFKVFACQNPFYQGGGRKGLPRSFLNRFTKVYIDELVEADYHYICSSLYPSIPGPLLSKLITFNRRLHEDTMLHHKFGQDGSPWEFNLRDVLRSCQIIEGASEKSKVDCFVNIVYVQRMRTAADRIEVQRLYEEVFGVKPSINPYPRVQLSPEHVRVGYTVIQRNGCSALKSPNSELKLLPSIRHCMEAVVSCVKHQWLCILIGPPSSGKTSLIRLLGQLSGNKLNELNLSTATDISELLGSFEQYNAFRNLRLVFAQVEHYVTEYCSLKLDEPKTEFITRRSEIMAKWLTLSSSMDFVSLSTSTFMCIENWDSIAKSLNMVIEIVALLMLDLTNNLLPVSWTSKELDKILKSISKFQEHHHGKPSAKFEWVTGLLVKAIENGEWVVLENANLCNPTVLDRINSLVEPSGSITVNECGLVDGSPLILRPHPNFRIFLTVNPTSGEVSRAMRNRGVEIYMMQPYWLLDEAEGYNHAEYELKDVERHLVLSGIPGVRLVESMAKAHVYARRQALTHGLEISYLELARWVQLYQKLLTSGNHNLWSLQISWEHTYLSSLGEAAGRDIISHGKDIYLSESVLKYVFSLHSSLQLPGGWPAPLRTLDFVLHSEMATVKQNCMYLETLILQYVGWSSHRHPMKSLLTLPSSDVAFLMNEQLICKLMFPETPEQMIPKSYVDKLVDVKMKRQVYYAANWTLEQATLKDYKLYLLHLSWLSSKVKPFSLFISSLLELLEKEFKHPIWECIFNSHRRLATHRNRDLSLQSKPLLSLDFSDVSASDGGLNEHVLHNAVNLTGLLRQSHQQWDSQNRHLFVNEAHCFKPVLESLQQLEEEVLERLVESEFYELLRTLYSDLIDHHVAFWEAFMSSKVEELLISWQWLVKDICNLRNFFPRIAENVLLVLRKRYLFEKRKLEVKVQASDNATADGSPTYCCVIRPELLWLKTGLVGWQETIPIVDAASFFLDMEILEKLSLLILNNPRALQLELASVTSLLEHALKYSRISGRPPQNFIPHQKILWMFDAWTSVHEGSGVSGFLLSAASSLFQQIIHAHEETFDSDTFAAIARMFSTLQKNIVKQTDLEQLSSLVMTSKHRKLTSLHFLIESVLKDLYIHRSSTVANMNVGYTWLRIGLLRFSLLITSDDLDPMMEYSYKFALLEDKISSLEVEIKVRQECDYLSGWAQSREAHENRKRELEKLKLEHKVLQSKIVFRSNPLKFKAFRKECKDFNKSVMAVMDFTSNIDSRESEQVILQVCNWQKTAKSFIERLSDEYKEYIDLAQPVQVALYEMKLGLSLVSSATLSKDLLRKINEDNLELLLDSIYSFLKFPRGDGLESISSIDLGIPTISWDLRIDLLEKLASISRDADGGRVVSVLQRKAAIYHNVLLRVVHLLAVSQRIDDASFKMLDKLFRGFAIMWMDMKAEVQDKEGLDAQQYKFKPRAFEIQNVIDADVSMLAKYFSNDSFSELKELLSEEDESSEKIHTSEDHGSLEEEWNLMQAPVLDSMIHFHNQLFGSVDLISCLGTFHISDTDKCTSFINSYDLGASMIRGLGGLFSSSLDAKLIPEHMFRLCLDRESKCPSIHRTSSKYKYYKDSNAPNLAKMVKLLSALQDKVVSLLNQWEDHPGLQKILDAVQSLLVIPMETPLAKALLGLQLLLRRVIALQENGSKLCLSDELEPLVALARSWQKMEVDSWAVLLDEVQEQYDTNAAKLWFALSSIFHRSHAASKISSKLRALENSKSDSSYYWLSMAKLESNMKILYNAFGYYVQFLPRILEHIGASRRNIEKELKDLTGLCRWEKTELSLSIEQSKRARQKVKKLIQKYTDILQQPFMLFLTREAEQKASAAQPELSINDLKESSEKGSVTLNTIADEIESRIDHRASYLSVEEEWNAVNRTLEEICSATFNYDVLWKDMERTVGKRRAFDDLLKLLESSGLDKHKFEKVSYKSDWLFVQPSFDIKHLLLTHSRLPSRDSNLSSSMILESSPNGSLEIEWKVTNEFYFKGIAAVQLLRQICLNPHQDIILEKELLDALSSMLIEESLLLETLETAHLQSCEEVKPAANHVLQVLDKFIPLIKKSKETLDKYLLSHGGMVQIVVEGSLDKYILGQGKLLAEELDRSLKTRDDSVNISEASTSSELNTFWQSFERTLQLANSAMTKQQSLSDGHVISEESIGSITSWESLFRSSVENLNLPDLCKSLLQTICNSQNLLSQSGGTSRLGRCFEQLHTIMDVVLSLGDTLLSDLVGMNRTVSIMTRELADVLASLFSKGFRTPSKDEVDENGASQDVSGTGLGEGTGRNDVSDEITDEDQLLGTKEKEEDQNGSGEVPNKNEKGIEMEEDFAADTFSVSEDSGEEEENDDNEEEKLDSAVGDAGPDSEAVDEKLWDNEGDENPEDKKEKYEAGSSVKDKDMSNRELRGKDDSTDIPNEESKELNGDDLNNEKDDEGDVDESGDGEENVEDMNLDKDEAHADPTGLNVDDDVDRPDEEEMEVDENSNETKDMSSGEEEGSENGEEDKTESGDDETMQDADAGQSAGAPEEKLEHGADAEDNSAEMNAQSKDELVPGMPDLNGEQAPNAESATQPNGEVQASDSRSVPTEANVYSSNANVAPLRNVPSGANSNMEIMVSDPSDKGQLNGDQNNAQPPEEESSSFKKSQPNPYRSIGDAFEKWKERAKVSTDDIASEAPPVEMEDKNANEYAYVSEAERGMEQSLGPATPDQVDANISGNKQEDSSAAGQEEEDGTNETEIDRNLKPSSAAVLKDKMEQHLQVSEVGKSKQAEEDVEMPDYNTHTEVGSSLQNLVSVRNPAALSDGVSRFDELAIGDDSELGKAVDGDAVNLNIREGTGDAWRRYELRTTRLFQELAEQLRLVLEPTVASKLQGDYKTGKRINMKKVIPYIASHYRKDKIWLRRTRPNKRDYQVVIAVDDSRSMSESRCGDVAVEALVTVCRAMSQLELGNFAVSSFGKKGNIRLLHDFERPFTGEAGQKIISSLTFSQENTIIDEPVVDLLKYLSNLLDTAVARARLPSGQNPLEQLVLIIADGRFHEKEKLKRCVRDFLSQKRMVAFLLLDNPEESVVDQLVATFVDEGDKSGLKMAKYMDSFPFPYYIVLRDIEALPRTLADLLRQWFEIMQSFKE
ncbi:unnamed protein product [Linum tenue]|uniref:Midasin n=1 Tax=Linum tenue TaxID=586396 RepID=A0AAV0KDH0_9ROSI|nr:unnamed protein product [Linum tenue]